MELVVLQGIVAILSGIGSLLSPKEVEGQKTREAIGLLLKKHNVLLP